MERLTKRITENQIELSAKANPTQYVNSPQRVHMKHPFWNVFNKLAYYEDLEEEGRLIILSVQDIHPCKHCDTGWGSISSEGCKSCYDDCKRLKEYNEKYSK